MSDIGLNLSCIIALFIFLVTAGGLGVCGLISLIIAFVKASRAQQRAKQQRAFAYFIAAVPLMLLNLIAFGILAYMVDSNANATNEFIDKAAAYVWLPLQPILWIVLGMSINKLKR